MSAFLIAAWECLAKREGICSLWDLHVEFPDVRILMPVPVQPGERVLLQVALSHDQHFQVSHPVSNIWLKQTLHGKCNMK